MPRVSREQTELNRIAIEEAASHLFREQGFRGLSVADLMAAAGLTHGGFYGHFESKDALAALACTRAFEQSVARWDQRIASHDSGRDALDAIVDGYLSARGRDQAGLSCPAAAWVSDVAREPRAAPVRAAYLEGIKGLLSRLSQLSDQTEASSPAMASANAGDAIAADPQALLRLATMVGALCLARATEGDPLSDQILAAARAGLQAPD